MIRQRLKLLVASTNQKKLKELQELLKGMSVDVVCLRELPGFQEVPEDGKTFEENAAIKALGYAKQAGLLTLAEDSGLCCDALDGAPGVVSARFAGLSKDDQANNRKVLSLMENVPDGERCARFVSAVALAEPTRLIGLVKGEVQGLISRTVQGTGGFGYDPIFFYPPYGKTFGQVSAEMKHQVSHRAVSLLKARGMIEDYLKK
ncbi:MAG: RdgB/HAM1 family non-canonical purine NTP pyrophosphatase [Candidatus Omnitrophica bacterium]|nr:RdgB/HAM1 family non-canonical purine NTP pyrophosphatase [Candidatus Omnitrophota bacterium]MDD5670264.1 RdgB/HAM1 family non-canonical purine NTP pyrophosphatase [Candidatus Omnitrophota bacterium]